MGYMLMAFGLGLIPYSVQYVVLRAFYAYEDTRTPFYNTVIVAVDALADTPGLSIKAVSAVYETDAVGGPSEQ
ncbi:lipid II flippase MurJ, partial [Kitasatospora purpeofusca]|uniref:lipid II flippase MurJ n=1 Tax=Kitasatospora purpeofusca TaxID=67352 RepID=UPI0035DA353A